MKKQQQFPHRKKKDTFIDKIVKFLQKHSYTETILILSIYLAVGYFLDNTDICMLHSKIPLLIILLSVITLFHGFENGILAITILAFVMFFTYDLFPYLDFLILLMMTLIFSQFHYYWTRKIKEAEVDADYKSVKLNELSRAFYSLKISHDQLEKNYVIKPMSIRNSLDTILSFHQNILHDHSVKDKKEASFKRFLDLLQKSFSVQSALVVYSKQDKPIDTSSKDLKAVYGKNTEEYPIEEIMKNNLVIKSLNRKLPIFISDEDGEPSLKHELTNRFIAVIPAVYDEEVIALLIIEKMPFMAFERENLTSIAILIEYFSMEITKTQRFHLDSSVDFIPDREFKYEVARLEQLHEKFKTDSTFIVLKMYNELESLKLKDKVSKMLRSLDMITYYKHNNAFFIMVLFPLQDKAAAEGFLNRLKRSLSEEDGVYTETIINIERTDLLHDLVLENKKEMI